MLEQMEMLEARVFIWEKKIINFLPTIYKYEKEGFFPLLEGLYINS